MAEKSRESGDRMDARSSEEHAGQPGERLAPEDGLGRYRRARLETIRSLLNSGAYDIPAMAVAERIIARTTAAPPGREK
jgi:hypothetical protein